MSICCIAWVWLTQTRQLCQTCTSAVETQAVWRESREDKEEQGHRDTDWKAKTKFMKDLSFLFLCSQGMLKCILDMARDDLEICPITVQMAPDAAK